MSRIHVGGCPALDDLLLADQGELTPARQATVSAHLAGCANCKSQLRAVASIIWMVGHVAKQFGESESAGNDAAEARAQRFLVRLHTYKQQRIFQKSASRSFRRLIAIAAVPLLILGLVYFESRGTVIEADELVKIATSAEFTRAAGTTQRVRIKLTRPGNFAMSGVGVRAYVIERELIDGIVTTSGPTVLEGIPASIARLLGDHRFNWRQPLSAVAFTAWRNALPHKHDQVTVARDLTGSTPRIVLRTTTEDDGDLHEVELTVERDSYRVTCVKFVFETEGTLEIEERSQWIRHAMPPATVVASNTATPPTRRAAAPPRVDPLSPAPPAPQPQPDLANWLQQRLRFSDAATRAQFMPEVRRLTSAIRERLDSLDDLAASYPGSTGPQASLAGRARLQREVDRQYDSLRNDLDALYTRVLTLTQPAKTVVRSPNSKSLRQEHAPADWSRRVQTAFPQASKLDRLTDELRAYDDLPESMRQQLAASFDALWAAIYAPLPIKN